MLNDWWYIILSGCHFTDNTKHLIIQLSAPGDTGCVIAGALSLSLSLYCKLTPYCHIRMTQEADIDRDYISPDSPLPAVSFYNVFEYFIPYIIPLI